MKNSTTGPIIVIAGTRPEGIKMVPVYCALRDAGFKTLLCSTGQHDELLQEVFDLFGIVPDFNLKVMRQGQDLFYLTNAILEKSKELFLQQKPSLIVVQGDTTTTMAAAMAAFYLSIPVAHVEAGLRTDDIHSPFPEEMNRRMVGLIAQYHFAPTTAAAAHLLAEGVPADRVFCVGNTVVDALRMVKEQTQQGAIVVRDDIRHKIVSAQAQGSKILVLTAHRRESFNGGIARILQTVKDFLSQHPEIICFYPAHPNPHVQSAVEQTGLHGIQNMILCKPLAYQDMAFLLDHADVVLTDSGGIQEEAVSLGKPVLILRDKTERMEGVWAGCAWLVGTDPAKIQQALAETCNNVSVSEHQWNNIYGDGYASKKIVTILSRFFTKNVAVEKQKNLASFVMPSMKEGVCMKKVSLLGLGYIGLPTGIVLADHGFEVSGFDVDKERVKKINEGDPVIHEPEVYEKLQGALSSGRFTATATLEDAEYYLVAVPTPFKEDKKADLSYVFDAVEKVATVLKAGQTVIIESTIPVKATEACAQLLEQKTGMRCGIDFFVAHCPERVLPGKIFHELVENDRIVGGVDKASVEKAAQLYKAFVRGTLYLTDATTAEMVKLVENSSRDAQIAFANQVASMAYAVGLNPFEVIELANKHPRVKILNPGCGVGGHCIAVDPWFLIETFPHHTQLLQAARQVNDNKPFEVIRCVRSAVAEWQKTHEGKCKVVVFGLTYKQDVDDLRESPALHIAQLLKEFNDIELIVCEPHVKANKLEPLFGHAQVSPEQGIDIADIPLFLIGHTQFKTLDRSVLAQKQTIDYCGIFYQSKKNSDAKEQLFWPARSMMDYFMEQDAVFGQLQSSRAHEERV